MGKQFKYWLLYLSNGLFAASVVFSISDSTPVIGKFLYGIAIIAWVIVYHEVRTQWLQEKANNEDINQSK